MGVSQLAFRLLGERMKVQGQQLLMLTTIGAKTGQQRRSIVARFPDRDHPGAWQVIGSNSGAAGHPSWCYNLRKNPNRAWITIGGKTLKVRAQSLEGAERDEAWRRVVSAAPGFARYETTTDRVIPIIRLTPETAA